VALSNVVTVTMRCDGTVNRRVPLFWAPAFSQSSTAMLKVQSSAALLKGYSALPDPRILPLAMDISLWRALRLGNGTVNGMPLVQQVLAPGGAPLVLLDQAQWDPQSRGISTGSDGVWEAMLLTSPTESLGSRLSSLGATSASLPNVATIVRLGIGGAPDDSRLCRQIRSGLSADDLAAEGFALPTSLRGQPSVNNAVLDALAEIKGQPRVILLFDTLSGTSGNTAKQVTRQTTRYSIVGWGGCVVTDVKRLLVANAISLQPAPYCSSRFHSRHTGKLVYSDLVYRSPVLVE